jgi:HK97 gp10 family phage protein
MRIKSAIIGSKDLAKALSKIQPEYEKALGVQLETATLALHNAAVKGIRASSPGEKQVRYSPKRTVTAAKPGTTPNTDMGTLLKSIGWNIDRQNLRSEVGSNLKYATYLEFGTQDMKARPWLSPAIERAKPSLIGIFRATKPKRKVG